MSDSLVNLEAALQTLSDPDEVVRFWIRTELSAGRGAEEVAQELRERAGAFGEDSPERAGLSQYADRVADGWVGGADEAVSGASRGISLSDYVAALRAELDVAQEAGDTAGRRFDLGPAELEVRVTPIAQKEGRIAFLVVTADPDAAVAQAATQRMTLQITPSAAGGGAGDVAQHPADQG